MMKKIKQSTLVLLAAMSWWSIGILIFGDFSVESRWYLFACSLVVLPFLINYKWDSNKKKFFDATFWYSFFSGWIASTFKLNPFILTYREPLLSITIDTSFSVIGWWSTMLIFLILASIYRSKKKEEFESGFETDMALDRQYKINQIVGKWWK